MLDPSLLVVQLAFGLPYVQIRAMLPHLLLLLLNDVRADGGLPVSLRQSCSHVFTDVAAWPVA